MKRKFKILIVALIIFIAIFSAYYVNDYYHAEKSLEEYDSENDNVNVSKISNGIFVDGEGNNTALIFYPGAKVEYTAYLPMLMSLADKGVDCYLVEMPFNFAFLGENSADNIIDKTNYSNYYMSGHSLGGVVASSYTNHSNRIEGLILFASYPTSDINVPVLSIYGSNDNVLNLEKYNESKTFFKNSLKEYIIKGGNHAQFGDYGKQAGDGESSISAISQREKSVDEIISFINN